MKTVYIWTAEIYDSKKDETLETTVVTNSRDIGAAIKLTEERERGYQRANAKFKARDIRSIKFIHPAYME